MVLTKSSSKAQLVKSVAYTCLLIDRVPLLLLRDHPPNPQVQRNQSRIYVCPPRPALLVSPPLRNPTIPPPTPLSPLREHFLQFQLLATPGRPPPHLARRNRRDRVAPVGVIPKRSSIAPLVCRRNAVSARASCHLPEDSRRGRFVLPAPVKAVGRGWGR